MNKPPNLHDMENMANIANMVNAFFTAQAAVKKLADEAEIEMMGRRKGYKTGAKEDEANDSENDRS